MRTSQLVCVLCAALIGVGIAKVMAQSNSPTFRYRPPNPWQTMNCETLCQNQVPRCLVDCQEIITLSSWLDQDSNNQWKGDFWFNQTANED